MLSIYDNETYLHNLKKQTIEEEGEEEEMNQVKGKTKC